MRVIVLTEVEIGRALANAAHAKAVTAGPPQAARWSIRVSTDLPMVATVFFPNLIDVEAERE